MGSGYDYMAGEKQLLIKLKVYILKKIMNNHLVEEASMSCNRRRTTYLLQQIQ